MDKRGWYIVGLLASALILLLIDRSIKTRVKYSTTSAYASHATGASIFYRLAKQTPGTVAAVKQSAILDANELSGADVFMLLSPRQPVSPREAGLLREFVRKGGTLVVSFESERSWRFLSPLLESFVVGIEAEQDPGFLNKQLETIIAAEDSPLLSAGETYAFYGRLLFSDSACERSRLKCFFRQWPYGDGAVYAFAGLPPIGNALIGRHNNREIAFRLLNRFDTLLFDEYRHFFSDKTTADLFLLPGFSLPLLGLVFGAIAFFLFGYSELRDMSPTRRKSRSLTSYHDLNSGIFLGLLVRSRALPAALEQHRRYLEHIFPRRRDEIREAYRGLNLPSKPRDADCFAAAGRLAALHRHFLQEKGFEKRALSGIRTSGSNAMPAAGGDE